MTANPHHPLSRRSLLGTAAIGIPALAASGALSSCSSGSSTSESGSRDAYKPGSAKLKVQLGKEIDGIHYPDGYNAPKVRDFEKFGDGKTEFRVVTRDYPGMKYSSNYFAQWLEQKTGVKVKYEVVPMGDEGAPKLNAMITSGDLPDAFMTGLEWMGGFSRSELYTYGQQGLFQPIGKLVDEYAPELLDTFKYAPKLRAYSTSPDGNMYAFPNINQCYHCCSGAVRMWVNKHWLSKLGLEHPKTLDDFHAMLVAFRDKNPSGLSGTIPLTDCKDGLGTITYIMECFVYPGQSYIDKQGDQLVFVPTEDGFREGLKYVAGLIKDGLMDKNAFTQTTDQLKRKMMNKSGPLAGVVYGYSQGSFCDVVYNDPKNPYRIFEALGPVTGPEGKCFVPWDYTVGGGTGLVLTKSCKDPATMIRWADAQQSILGTLSATWGPQSGPDGFQGFTWAKKGEKGIDGRQAVYSPQQHDASLKNYSWWQWNAFDDMFDVRNSQAADPNSSIEPSLYQASKLFESHQIPEDRYFAEPVYDTDQAAQVGELSTNLSTYYTQAVAQFCLGHKDINSDADWTAYKDKFNQIGVETYLKIQTDAMNASN